jgi:Flp pilus assembly protein TadD
VKRILAAARLPHLFLALLAVAAVAAYSPSLRAPFVFDDHKNILENPNIRMTSVDARSLFRALTPYENLNLRPLSFLTFALNYRFGRYEPFGYHVVNLAILLLSIPAAYLLAARLGRAWLDPLQARAAALGATALWTLHPLLTNGVSFVVQRMTSLYALFSLVALLLFLRGRESRSAGSYALAAAALLCAFASKETAAVTPLLALLALWLLPREAGGSGARAGWVLAGLVAASLAGMGLAGGASLRAGWIPPPGFGMAERALTETRVVLRYLELFLLPLPSRLTFDYDFPLSTSLLAPPSTLLAVAFHAGLLALAAWLRRRRPLSAFCIFAFYLLQLPEGTFMPLDLIFEHRAYFPAFFLSLALMDLLLWGFERLRVREAGGAALAAAVAIGALWGVFGYQRNLVWADPVPLWEDTVAKSPGSARVHQNLGISLGRAGRHVEAQRELREAIRIKPDDPWAHMELSRELRDAGRGDEALEQARTALELKPNSPTANNNLGLTLGAAGRPEQAVAYLQKAILLKPDFLEACNNLAGVYGMLGRYDEAAELSRRAIAIKPDYALAHFNLGVSLLRLGRVAEAAAVVRTLQRIDPALAAKLSRQLAGG